ncbi:Imm21 family immunity protein [Haliangium sp.]
MSSKLRKRSSRQGSGKGAARARSGPRAPSGSGRPPRSKGLVWISTDGGPMILMPRAALMAWGGVEPPRDGRVIEARAPREDPDRPACDYDRACEVEGVAAVIDVNERDALVVAGEALPTAWIPHDRGGVLVRVAEATRTRAELEAHLRAVVERDGVPWQPLDGQLLRCGEPGWLLFDASCPGWEIELSAAVKLAPGRYRLAVATHRDSVAVVHLLQVARPPR